METCPTCGGTLEETVSGEFVVCPDCGWSNAWDGKADYWHAPFECPDESVCELHSDSDPSIMTAVRHLRKAGIRCSVGDEGIILDERRDGRVDAQGFLHRALA